MSQRLFDGDAAAAAFRTGAESYARFGSPLYASLCTAGAEDASVIELAMHAQPGAQPVFHLLTVIHYLLLREPDHSLARYFATLNASPLPASEAGPAFRDFCSENYEAIIETLSTTTVQTTFPNRCATMLLPIASVADMVGEPMHLIEIGCSAGVLLTLDSYAYQYDGHERFGPADAPIVFSETVVSGPPLRIPTFASRTGLDLRPLFAADPDDHRWLIAQIFPEYRQQREELEIALDVVASCDIRMVKGDALETLPLALEATGVDSVCIFHSVCLSYWTEEARIALDRLLMRASESGRTLFRVGSEPSAQFSAWNKGHDRSSKVRPSSTGEITMTRYTLGRMDHRIVATNGADRPIEWHGW